MDNYSEVLSYLIKLKKTKKDHNKIERDTFVEAWDNLVSAEGYSKAADFYLYNGFTYCGAEPFKKYLYDSKDPLKAMKDAFSLEMYGKNCASTVPVLFNLFALLVNSDEQKIDLISELIRRIPKALKNKEGKVYGQAGRALKKYMLDILQGDKLPEFTVMTKEGLEDLAVEEFITGMDEVLSGIVSEGYSKKSQRNINFIKKWMHPSSFSEPDGEEEKTDNDKMGNQSEASSVQRETTDSLESIISTLEKKITSLRIDNEILKKDIEARENTILIKENSIEHLTRTTEIKEKRINQLLVKLDDEKKELERLNVELEQKNSELAQRTQMNEALSRDRAKQTDEAFNRLASKLRIEFRDFQDALDLPMDLDLGENMRQQLKNVFSILIKNGIAIK